MLSPKKLLNWYDQNARILPWRISPAARKTGALANPYRVWLSEIMLQQTTVITVKDYYARFLSRWPTVADLAAAPLDDVLSIWAGLGYYARARNLHACAKIIVLDKGGTFPQSARELQELPGIGPYTGAAIAAICHDEKVAVVDGNVERVSARILTLAKPVRQEKQQIRDLVQQAVPKRAGDFAQSLMDLGATICTPSNPQCFVCPLSAECRGYKIGKPEKFPIKPQKKKRPVRYGHAFLILQSDGKVLLRKRADTGLLAKMSEVPNSDWLEKFTEVCPPLPGDWQKLGHIIHVFTHFQLELDVWVLQAVNPSIAPKGFWVSPDEVQYQALPTLFKKVLALRP